MKSSVVKSIVVSLGVLLTGCAGTNFVRVLPTRTHLRRIVSTVSLLSRRARVTKFMTRLPLRLIP